MIVFAETAMRRVSAALLLGWLGVLLFCPASWGAGANSAISAGAECASGATWHDFTGSSGAKAVVLRLCLPNDSKVDTYTNDKEPLAVFVESKNGVSLAIIVGTPDHLPSLNVGDIATWVRHNEIAGALQTTPPEGRERWIERHGTRIGYYISVAAGNEFRDYGAFRADSQLLVFNLEGNGATASADRDIYLAAALSAGVEAGN